MGAGAIKKIKHAVIVALCLCLAVCTVDGVWAYITAKTHSVSNTFTPAWVSCAVEESFQDGVKSEVKIRNTGNVDAYIRATAVVTFVSEDGKVLATAPQLGVDYTLEWTNNGWRKEADGYWYYAVPVPPAGCTSVLISQARVLNVPEGYRLNVQILATAVQADPVKAVKEAWGL